MKFNFLKGLRTKLIANFLLVAIIPAVIIGFFSYNNSKKSIEAAATNQLTFIRDSKKKEIEDYIYSVKNRMSFTAQEPFIIETMQQLKSEKNGENSDAFKKCDSFFQNFVNKFEQGDILLVDDKSGNILYSVLKESDYKSNILNGVAKNTVVAQAFQAARDSKDKNFTIITDYQFYEPSNNKPIICISAPIYNNNEKVGVIIFKMPSTKIDSMVSNSGNWEGLHLGSSGDVVIVGPDFKMRNTNRFWNLENDSKILETKSAMLLKEAKTTGTINLMQGITNTEKYVDYRGIPTISAYTPLQIDNLKWGMAVKKDQKEAFKASDTLREFIILILLVSIALIVFSAYILSTNISNPLKKITKVALLISEGDLTIEMPKEKRSDEIGTLSEAIAIMLNNLKEQIKEFINVVNVIASSVSEISVTLSQVSSAATETSSAVSETTSTVEEVKQTVFLSNEKTKKVANSSKESLAIAEVGQNATEVSRQSMKDINLQMQAIAESILVLSEQSQNISELIESVDNISEQSNLLAVNAAIEAAKAGEYGKGFSIVAQEIRNLSEGSKYATKQVRNILKDIQKATNSSVMTTEKGIKLVEKGVDQVAEAGDAIRNLIENVNVASHAVIQIETSSQQQLIGMDQVAFAMEGINQASFQNLESMRQLEDSTYNLKEMGQKLKQIIERYKV
jgi:methyl-accepting chemotaxis protein